MPLTKSKRKPRPRQLKPRGYKKTRTLVEGHQECGTCHPEQKSLKARARRNDRKLIEEPLILPCGLPSLYWNVVR